MNLMHSIASSQAYINLSWPLKQGKERAIAPMAAMSWFLQAAITMIVGKSDDGGVKAGKGWVKVKSAGCKGFRVPLHYPRYRKEDYERMDEWKLDMLLREYGLEVEGPLEEKRWFAMETFLWPDQL